MESDSALRTFRAYSEEPKSCMRSSRGGTDAGAMSRIASPAHENLPPLLAYLIEEAHHSDDRG